MSKRRKPPMIVKVYDEKTGDPTYDNRARQYNKTLSRSLAGAFRMRARGRRRRRQLMNAKFPHYVRLVALVAERMREEDGRAS